MAQNDVFEVSVGVMVSGTPTAVVMHCEQSTVGDPASSGADVISAMIAKGIFASWQARSSSSAKIECVKVKRIAPTVSSAYVDSMSYNGSVMSSTMPAQCGTLQHWQADPWTRRQVGHHSWSGIPQSAVHRGRLITAQLILEGTFATEFNDVMVGTSQSYQWGVWSELNGTIAILGFATPRIVVHVRSSRRALSCF